MQTNTFRRRVLNTLAIMMAIGPGVGLATTQVTGVTIQSLSIYAGSSGATGIEVIISPPLPNGTEGCSYTPANTLFIDFASTVQPDGKTLYASVLAAMLAGKQVTFGILGCAINGELPLIYRVDVTP